jgi:hypothetical protein
MRPDLAVKPKQGFLENTRNLYIILGAFLSVVAVVSALVRFEFGQTLAHQTQPMQIIFQPGSIQVLPSPPTK